MKIILVFVMPFKRDVEAWGNYERREGRDRNLHPKL